MSITYFLCTGNKYYCKTETLQDETSGEKSKLNWFHWTSQNQYCSGSPSHNVLCKALPGLPAVVNEQTRLCWMLGAADSTVRKESEI